MFDWLKNLWRPKALDPYAELQPWLEDLVKGHGLDASTYGHWVLPDNNLPALRAFGHQASEKPDFVTRQIDIELKIDDQRSIVDQYGGYGETLQKANANAMYTFCVSTFHVYLSAFWDHHEPDQVEIETWQVGGIDWTAYNGNTIYKMSDGQKAGVAPGYIDAVKTFLYDLPLHEDLHWISVFVARAKEDLTVDTHIDNTSSPELNAHLAELEWPAATGFYSARHFILLKKR